MAFNVEWFEFQGKATWAQRLVHPDEFQGKRFWSIQVHLTPESYNLFMKLKEGKENLDGILNHVKKDDDGYYVIFRRPCDKQFKPTELPRILTPPEVIMRNGEPFRDIIGNGSDITVKVERYTYKKKFGAGRGSAIRLVSVIIDNLVPYSRKDFDSRQEMAVEGLEQTKPQTW